MYLYYVVYQWYIVIAILLFNILFSATYTLQNIVCEYFYLAILAFFCTFAFQYLN